MSGKVYSGKCETPCIFDFDRGVYRYCGWEYEIPLSWLDPNLKWDRECYRCCSKRHDLYKEYLVDKAIEEEVL